MVEKIINQLGQLAVSIVVAGFATYLKLKSRQKKDGTCVMKNRSRKKQETISNLQFKSTNDILTKAKKMFGLSVREFKFILSVILVAIYVAALVYRWRTK